MKILIIDRDTLFLQVFVPMLEECLAGIGMSGCQIVTTTEGDSYIRESFEEKSSFLIFMDILQNENDSENVKDNGIALAREIRKKDPSVPIVFISSINDFAQESYEVDAAYFVLKPLDQEDCYEMLFRLLHNRCLPEWKIDLSEDMHCRLGDIVYIRQNSKGGVLYFSDKNINGVIIPSEMLDHLLKAYGCFYRVNSDTVVNLWHIKTLEKRAVLLSNGHYISASKKQVENVKRHQINTQIRHSSR